MPVPVLQSHLKLSALDKSFGETRVLRDVSLSIREGEVLVLLGPSGSGKTTLLRLIAGFERPSAGEIEMEGEEITSLAPAKRHFGMVFQHYALFPHLSVGQNVGFGLEGSDLAPEARDRRVEAMLELVDLPGFGERRVHELSGGQQQRVALARALAPEPRVLLLDEPLSNLDPTLRVRTRRQLRETLKSIGITAVWVTHEQEEAFDVGDRVAVLNDGRLEQLGTPEELYEAPVSRFVAGFVGRASFLAATMGEAGDAVLGDPRFVGTSGRWPVVAPEDLTPGQAVDLMARPDGLRFAEVGAENVLTGEVRDRRFAGEATYYQVEVEGIGSALVLGDSSAAALGETVGVTWRSDGPRARAFPRVEEGEEQE